MDEDEQLDDDQHGDLEVQCAVGEALVGGMVCDGLVYGGLAHDEQAHDGLGHDYLVHDVQVRCREHNHDDAQVVDAS